MDCDSRIWFLCPPRSSVTISAVKRQSVWTCSIDVDVAVRSSTHPTMDFSSSQKWHTFDIELAILEIAGHRWCSCLFSRRARQYIDRNTGGEVRCPLLPRDGANVDHQVRRSWQRCPRTVRPNFTTSRNTMHPIAVTMADETAPFAWSFPAWHHTNPKSKHPFTIIQHLSPVARGISLEPSILHSKRGGDLQGHHVGSKS